MSSEIEKYLDFWKHKIMKEQKPKTLYLKVNSSENGMNCAKYAVKAFYLVILSVMI